MLNTFLSLPVSTIEKALAIRKNIEALQASLNHILGEVEHTAAVAAPVEKVDGRKNKRSAAVRAKMAAAAKARWANKKGAAAATTPAEPVIKGAKKKKRTMSPEARARIAAAQKARWAKQKA